VVVCVVGILVPKDHLNQSDADMKTRDEMIYDFMLALAPNYQAMYEEVFKNESHVASFERAADEIFKRAEKLTDLYLEWVAP